jgi:hypothetical protein
MTANNVRKASRYGLDGWCNCYGLGTNKDTITIHTAEGTIIGYVYGEKTWFDSREERDAYRAQRNADREEELKRNKMLKAIMEHYKTMSTEELEQVMAIL